MYATRSRKRWRAEEILCVPAAYLCFLSLVLIPLGELALTLEARPASAQWFQNTLHIPGVRNGLPIKHSSHSDAKSNLCQFYLSSHTSPYSA